MVLSTQGSGRPSLSQEERVARGQTLKPMGDQTRTANCERGALSNHREMACAKATKEAMERLVQAGSLAPLSVRTLAGFSVAGLGVGCYRMGLKQADVLLHTLRQGSVNVIDTSSTYVAGDSERMIGHVLSTPELRGRRRELVVVSKVGYLQGPLLAEAVEREATGRLWPEVRPCPCNARDQSFLSFTCSTRYT